jgi:homoserine dehydrogenase
MINIALLGFGTVGSGVAEVLTNNEKIISAKLGDQVNIKYILDLRDFPDSPFADRIVHDYGVILADSEVSIVVEMIGGIKLAADFTEKALRAGKSVVTSNKAVVAAYGEVFLELAREMGVRYLFEASVGGGIPVIRPIAEDLSHNKILSVSGILNGTTNFILNEMSVGGCSFDEALAKAQANGYAEADPADDIDGVDAARKIIILTAISYGKLLSLEDVSVSGIRDLPLDDALIAERFGCHLKLIADARVDESGKICASVAPRFVKNFCPLSTINGVFNGILVRGNASDDIMFYGRGAGKMPTAGAVVSDIIDVISRPSAVIPAYQWQRVGSDATASINAKAYCHIFDSEDAANAAALASGACVASVNNTYAIISSAPVADGAVRRYELFE